MKKNKNILLTFIFLTTLISCATVDPEYSLYRENGKYGLINEKREIVLSAEYDEIQENEVYLCKSEEKGNYVYSETLEVLHKFEDGQHSIIMCSPSLFYFKTGEKWYIENFFYSLPDNTTTMTSLKAINGNKSNAPWIAGRSAFFKQDLKEFIREWHCTYPYRENRAVVFNIDFVGEIIDEKFSLILGEIKATADYYSEGLIPVVMNSGESRYVDVNGNVVYECDFDFDYVQRGQYNSVQVPLAIGSFVENVAVVKAKENQWFILDRDFNKHFLPEGYEVESYSYSNGLLLVSKTENKEKLYGFIDKECNLVIPCEFSYAESFDGKYAIVEKDGKDAVIDKKGRVYYSSEFKNK